MAGIHGTGRFKETKVCVVCGNVYTKARTRSRRSWAKSQFCSLSCINVGRSPVTKGKKTGKPSWNSGRECPETSGERNGAWKGGVDRKTWRKFVLKRDDFTCQVCGLREPEIMQVDHIKPESLFPELAKVAENLTTLCPNCHARKTVRELKAGVSVMGKKTAGTAVTI